MEKEAGDIDFQLDQLSVADSQEGIELDTRFERSDEQFEIVQRLDQDKDLGEILQQTTDSIPEKDEDETDPVHLTS